MKERIREKINEIEEYLSRLIDIIPDDLKLYKSDDKARWSCEHGFEKIAEAIADLAFLVIKENKLMGANDDFSTFDVLKNSGIITKELSIKLQDIKKMRNIISHKYGEVDDDRVFNAIKEELGADINEFLNSVSSFLEKEENRRWDTQI